MASEPHPGLTKIRTLKETMPDVMFSISEFFFISESRSISQSGAGCWPFASRAVLPEFGL